MPKYKDLNINFTKNDFTDDVNIAKDLDAIRQSVTNLCLFGFGDKPFNPRFGVGVYDLLFETLSPEDQVVLGNRMQRHFEVYEPRVIFDYVKFTTLNSGDLEISVRYLVDINEDEPVPQTISLSLGRIR